MNVLGLCSYPVESAATRYRLIQYVEPLREKGIELTVSPFLDSAQFKRFYSGGGGVGKIIDLLPSLAKRFAETLAARRYDLIFVQREAMFFGPAFFEWIFQKMGNAPVILDLDDATYIPYVSPTYGKLGSFFKFFGKTDRLIERAATVVCGNRFIAEYVEKKGTRAVIVPTVADTEKFTPVAKNNAPPVVGWIGTHSTYPSLESIFPALQRLARRHDFTLRIVGAGREKIALEGVNVENLVWNLERETSDFQTLDIGLYPIATSASASEQWLVGKSGFKAIQYLSVGVPYVVTPVGVCAEIGTESETHFAATTDAEWETALEKLLSDANLREKMGARGRKYALSHFTIEQQAGKLAAVFQNALENSRSKVKL